MAHFREVVRSGSDHLELQDILKAKTSVLLGVTIAAEAALADIGIQTVFDLGTSWLFSNACAASNASRVGSVSVRFGRAPSDLLKPLSTYSSLEAIGSLDLDNLRGIDTSQAANLKNSLGVTTIREFGLWPPHIVAHQLVAESVGSTAELNDGIAEELRPRFGEYPTERVYYDTLVMLEMQHDDTPRTDLSAAGAISLKSIANNNKVGFTRPAIGAMLTFSQSWYSQGVTLGQMLHSLALAPGEATRIAVIDWTRRTRAATSETIAESERLDSTTMHNRSLSEVQSAVASEAQQGFSRTDSGSTSSSASAALSMGTGFIPSLWADVEASGTMQTASTSAWGQSSSWTTGERSIEASLTQRVQDRTEQHSSSARNRRASAVREVSQSEHEQVSTRIVANYNHMHALTVQYYEVVQVYRVVTQLHRAERCLFVPMQLLDFTDYELVERFRGALLAGALTRRAAELIMDDESTVRITPVVTTKVVVNNPNIARMMKLEAATVHSAIKASSAVESADSPLIKASALTMTTDFQSIAGINVWKAETIAQLSRHVGRAIIRPGSDDLFYPDDTQLVALSFYGVTVTSILLDRVGEASDTTLSVPSGTSWLDLSQPALLAELDGIALTKGGNQPQSGSITLQCTNRRGTRFSIPIPVALPEGTAMQRVVKFTTDKEDRRRELVKHLEANKLHYSQAVYRALDSATIVMLLSQYDWEGKPLADQVEPRPITVAGNYLILRAPIDRTEPDPAQAGKTKFTPWGELLAKRGITFTPGNQRLIPLPTAGVFAEAVLGRSNSAEKLDITRFWNWQDSPIPLQPTEIAPVATGTRATSEDLKPGSLSQPVLNIVNPTSLPEPSGLGGILTALSNGNMFRDMSGLVGTQQLAQAGMAGTLQAATEAGQLASENMRTSAQKTVAMAQVAADIVKAVVGAGGGGSSVQGISGAGAKINHGRDMDKRGVPSASQSSSGSSGNVPSGSSASSKDNSSSGAGSSNSQGAGTPSLGSSTLGDGNYSHEAAYANQSAFGFSPEVVGKTVQATDPLFQNISNKESSSEGGTAPASAEFRAFYQSYLDRVSHDAFDNSAYRKERDFYTLKAYQTAFGKNISNEWDPELGVRANWQRILRLYDYYQAMFLRKPNVFLWAGLGRLAGGAVLGGLSNVISDPSFLTNTMALIGKAIFLDLAWQHEAFDIDPQKAIALAAEHDKRYKAKFSYEQAWKKIATGNSNQVAEGNQMLLANEQFSIIQPFYDAIRQSKEADSRWFFGKTSAFTNNIHPYHRNFYESFPTTRNADVIVANDRWEWITMPNGMWDNWIRMGHDERIRLVRLSMDDLINHRWGPVKQSLLPPGST
jgi:hypothetical protein